MGKSSARTSDALRDQPVRARCRAVAARPGPPRRRIQVKPTIHVQIESGRVAITVEAELAELAGHLRHLEAEVPENIQIIEVTADGLSDWTVSADHRLHLMFDRPIAGRSGSCAFWPGSLCDEDPLQISTRQHHVKTPWFWWDGVGTERRLLDDLVDREAGDARIDGLDIDLF